MALTINPAVCGTRKLWIRSVLAFLIGAFIGGVVSLLAVLVVMRVATTFFDAAGLMIAALVVVGWGILHDLGLPLPMPYRSRQVPEILRQVLPSEVVAAAFGAQLGVGFLTLFTYSTHLALLILLPFADSLAEMLAALAFFAVGKSLVLFVATGVTSVDQIAPRCEWTRARGRLLRVITAATSITLALSVVVDPPFNAFGH